MATPTWLQYSNQGATRSLPLSPQLVDAFGKFLPELGVTMQVFSGGQEAEGPNRVGSHRHDHGNSGDVFFYKDGRRLDWGNPQDLPFFEQIVSKGKGAGLTGFGAGPGYMQPGSMHVGFGSPGVWGAGGAGRNAPDWLRQAFSGSPAGQIAATPPPQANMPDGSKGQKVYAPSLGSMAPTMTASAPTGAVPPAVTAQATQTPTDRMASIFGAMAMGQQDQGPQFAPVQIQGPSPDQSTALANFIKSLQSRMA